MFIGMCILFVIGIAVNIGVALKSKNSLIIAIDSNGARVVSAEKDPIFKTEATRFIQRFLASVYNFQSDTFVKQIGYAANVMSDELWSLKKDEIMNLKDRVEADQVILKGNIQKLSLGENGIYYALVDVSEKSRISEKKHLVKISLKLKQTVRNNENPSGLLVDSYEEELINN